jgi:hypothetical protein
MFDGMTDFVIWALIIIVVLLVKIGLMVEKRFNELEGKLDELLDAIANKDKDEEGTRNYEFVMEDLDREYGWESPDESPNGKSLQPPDAVLEDTPSSKKPRLSYRLGRLLRFSASNR